MKTANPLTDKAKIVEALKAFDSGSLVSNAIHLFDSLGYRSSKTLQLEPNTTAGLLELANRTDFLNPAKAHADEWQSVDFLFQLTDEEIRNLAQGGLDFDSEADVHSNKLIESYIFFAVELKGDSYPRTVLADITREINRLFPMPALVLFKHGKALTLSIINRRVHKRDAARDVLEKVTLIKDIRIEEPHRGQVEILFDLAFPQLVTKFEITNFVQLDEAWRKTLDTSVLNKRFYKDLANWYFWALQHVEFPKQEGVADDVNRATNVIRLITRLIFVWFLKERELVPDALFDRNELNEVLRDLSDDKSTFYKAILQNLFFATLNTPTNDTKAPRVFRQETNGKRFNEQYMVHNQYRHEKLFKDSKRALEMFAGIPFLNGGLFECLDKREEINGKVVETRIDGFSDMPKKQPTVPNKLFFGLEEEIDLNQTYDTRHKRYAVRGLIDTLDRYKFTIAENTPIEEEVALDPELLGKVFENLLASYNPETGATARKQTGSFYTPREIVNYMVDESLIAYLEIQLSTGNDEAAHLDLNVRLRQLFAYTDEPHQFSEELVNKLIAAIDRVKILDPACGSGAFPMGILQRLVFILSKLDPNNAKWEQRQIERVGEAMRAAERIEDHKFRENTLKDLQAQIVNIEEAFARNELDYGRKLFLIENCIYGVDIQPIAIQIAKLRFFISLIIDQRIRPEADNLGIRPLPNLETKFVAANTLVSVEKPAQAVLQNEELRRALEEKERELKIVRERHFTARTTKTKDKYRKEDERLRREIGNLLEKDNWSPETTAKLVAWNPYDQNASAEFFDPEWMFWVVDGFDIVIGNPPYIDSEGMVNIGLQRLRDYIAETYVTAKGNWDIYIAFIEKSFNLLSKDGGLMFITPDKWISKPFGEEARRSFLKNISSILVAGRDVFESSKVDSIVTRFSKHHRAELEILRTTSAGFIPVSSVSKSIIKPPYALDFLFSQYLSLLLKLELHPRKFSDYLACESACATSDAYKLKPLIMNHGKADPSSADYLRVVNTGTIGKFVSKWGMKPMTYLKDKYLFPVVKKSGFRRAFKNSYYDKAVNPKLIIKGLTLLDACIDMSGEIIPGKSTLVVVDADVSKLKAASGLINSRLWIFYISEKYSSSSYNEGTTFTKDMINNFPLPSLGKTERRFEGLVDQILNSKGKDQSVDTSKLEREIDQLVYDLYELTPEERAIVEASTQRRGKVV